MIFWQWARSGNFIVKSTYDHLTRDDRGYSFSKIWRSKIPYKIKMFLWLLENDATLTKDNMIKRKWIGDTTCRFRDEVETTEHLFFQCPTTRVIWGIVANCIGADTIPTNVKQYWLWIEKYFPRRGPYPLYTHLNFTWASTYFLQLALACLRRGQPSRPDYSLLVQPASHPPSYPLVLSLPSPKRRNPNERRPPPAHSHSFAGRRTPASALGRRTLRGREGRRPPADWTGGEASCRRTGRAATRSEPLPCGGVREQTNADGKERPSTHRKGSQALRAHGLMLNLQLGLGA